MSYRSIGTREWGGVAIGTAGINPACGRMVSSAGCFRVTQSQATRRICDREQASRRHHDRAALAFSYRSAERPGRRPKVLSKQGGQVALARAADLERDIGERQLFTRQQPHRPPDAAADNVLVRRHPRGQFEAAAEGERIEADRPSDLLPLELRVQVVVDEPDGAAQPVPRQSRIAAWRFPIAFNRSLSKAGYDRLCQLFGTIIAPIILRGALDEMNTHHAQRVLDSAQRHSRLHWLNERSRLYVNDEGSPRPQCDANGLQRDGRDLAVILG